jgi:hypothetical protein
MKVFLGRLLRNFNTGTVLLQIVRFLLQIVPLFPPESRILSLLGDR